MDELTKCVTSRTLREKADQCSPETIKSQWREREVTLASGEENEVGEGAVMAVKRFFGRIWWCGVLGCCFCGDWRRKEK
ncbi:hypothetical protein H5410_009610 [Solanum commersonii]|uniref:Uncharacterized protein n=1 Tax=Solanum commersonii TaxID=4109 RepID=A0A9J6AIG8_SOLCO|nr:hypothetical protein H5410_009610 [Solanum commersonii]